MIIVIAATEMEMAALKRPQGLPPGWESCVTGVGLTATALNLTRYLSGAEYPVEGVVQFGVGGAYCREDAGSNIVELLDICVATREVLGDLGISLGDSIDYLPDGITGALEFELESSFSDLCKKALDIHQIPYLKGAFVSVNAASGTKKRGDILQKRWAGLCENMEGAAAAQVCGAFSVPFFEVRSISNMVEDRNPTNWRLQEACEKAGRVTATLLEHLTGAW